MATAAAAAAVAASDEPPRKRASADAEDRLSELPDCLLHDIHALVGSRQAVGTSVLSRRLRHVWRSVPCVVIDPREFRGAGGEGGAPTEADCNGFEDFADVILSPTLLGDTTAAAAPLDAFRLYLLYAGRFISFDRWVRRALKRCPVSVDIHSEYGGMLDWPPGLSLGSGTGTGTSRLKRLHLFGLNLGFISGDGERLTQLLPVLEDLHMESCTYGHGSSTSTIARPTLNSLAVVLRRHTARHYTLTVTSPRISSLRLFLPFSRTHAAAVRIAPEGSEVLDSLVSASISILDTDQQPNLNRRTNKHKLDFLTSTRSMLDRFLIVRNLDLSGFTTIALLDKKSQEFPMLHNLTTLLLSACDVGYSCHALKSILLNAPNLEHLRLHHCKFIDIPKRKRGNTKSKARSSTSVDSPSPSSLCKNLQSMEIKWRREDNGLKRLVEFIKEIIRGTKLHFKISIHGGTLTASIRI